MVKQIIPLVDLQAQYLSIRDDVNAAVLEVLDSTRFVLGPAVEDFEGRFARYCQAGYAIAVNSGTSALHLALLAAGVGPGDEVITVSMTFVATVAAIDQAGATAVFVDVDPTTFNMDPTQIESVITGRTKAIMPVHLHGQMADMDPILEVARKHGLAVVEDAAQAHGAEYKGRRAGSVGDIAGFSFYPGKNLGAYGEGGAVVTNNPEYAEKVRMLRDWGQEAKYQHVLRGFNYRMDGVQGAVLGVKLNHIEDWTEARRRHAARYDQQLASSGVPLPTQTTNNRHVYHVYAVQLSNRDDAIDRLAGAGVGTGIHYPVPVHLQPAYDDLGHGAGSLPVTEALANGFLSLPMYAELTDEQITTVCRELLKNA